MKKFVSMKNGDEYDALTKTGKRNHIWRPKQRRKIKKAFGKRERKALKKDIDNDLLE